MNRTLSPRRIGFVATRFSGTDGVSLEASKWLHVLETDGHVCYFVSGECAQAADRCRTVPEMHFQHPDIAEIYATSFTSRLRPAAVTRRIHEIKDHLKLAVAQFVGDFDIELLVIENALSIPMNLPLGLALTEYIAESGLPAIAHHHDFFWERKRFLVNCVWDYLNMAFPPHLPQIRHVVINSSASNQLSLRTGISGTMIPNVMDFAHPPPAPDDYARGLRADLGLAEDEHLLLQPTRVVQRKGIEHAIELVDRLGVKARLVISHAGGDEGTSYEGRLRRVAQRWGVPVAFEDEIIRAERGLTDDGRRIYSLPDAYAAADLVTYPSMVEGFGNAFLEAIYYRRPIVVNNYSIFATDIRPKGFHVIEFDGFITDETVWWTERLLQDPEMATEMTAHNYAVGVHHYSYAVLRRHLQALMMDIFGEAAE
jgi:glycosyltransferase involved in cell wall biosynthesis